MTSMFTSSVMVLTGFFMPRMWHFCSLSVQFRALFDLKIVKIGLKKVWSRSNLLHSEKKADAVFKKQERGCQFKPKRLASHSYRSYADNFSEHDKVHWKFLLLSVLFGFTKFLVENCDLTRMHLTQDRSWDRFSSDRSLRSALQIVLLIDLQYSIQSKSFHWFRKSNFKFVEKIRF